MKLNELINKFENMTEEEQKRALEGSNALGFDTELRPEDLRKAVGGIEMPGETDEAIRKLLKSNNEFLTAFAAVMTSMEIIDSGVCPLCKASVPDDADSTVRHINSCHPEFGNVFKNI